MVFEIKGKVALVTGGARGIGLGHVRHLLKRGVRGIVIADVESEDGEKLLIELKNEFGSERIVFVNTDVADSASFENAFKVTLYYFQNIDILINNAGIFRDDIWKREIDINLKGTINGMILGLEKYLRYHKQEDEAVILNTSSIGGISSVPLGPIYGATKFGIIGLTKSWGESFHFGRTKVRVVVICPGMTDTAILPDMGKHLLNSEYVKLMEPLLSKHSSKTQSTDTVGRESINVLEKAPNGSIWIIENSQPAYEYKMPDRTYFKNNIVK